MKNNVPLGLWRYLLPVPEGIWKRQVQQSALHNQQGLGFLSADHRHVRNYVVRELACLGQPLPPDLIASDLGLPLEKVNAILDDLENRLSFLYRNGTESVVWAYPVTVDQTPHRATMSSGESINAA
jgi:hypothetical protein